MSTPNDSEQPLISSPTADEEAHLGDAGPSAPPSLFLYLLTLSAGLSGLLFGYDTGIISATLLTLTLPTTPIITPLQKSIITSSTSLAALFASPLASPLSDALGRRPLILIASTLFALGALIQALSDTVALLIVGRAVVGVAVGAASFVVPLYLAEVAPRERRGGLITVNVVFITLGQVAAYIVGWALGPHGGEGVDAYGNAWRWMVGLGAAPAILQGAVMGCMPESPRWLVMVGRTEEARHVAARIAFGDAGGCSADEVRSVDATVKAIEREVREEAEGRRLRGGKAKGRAQWVDALGELFRVKRNRRALAVACLLQGLQQLCGFNSLMYFSATIFQMLGFPIPTLTSLVVAVTNFAFTLVALFLIDRIGRRRILLWSIPFMVAGLLLAAYGFSHVDLSSTVTAVSPSQSAAAVILVSIMIYVAGYAIGLGNVPWMQSELFALNVRSLGSGIATATNWGANFVVGLTFLLLMDALTPPWTFVLYAVVCAGGYGLIWRFYPETTGLSLEEAATLLEDDNWGVR